MAYLQTTATSISDILDTIEAFAEDLGWTSERNNTFTSGSTTQRILTLSYGGVDYAHFASEGSTSSAKTIIRTMRSVSIDTIASLSNQPERSTQADSNLLNAGPYSNLWLFGEVGATPYIHCVLEYVAGRYRHFGVGDLVKKGVWEGGSYCYGTFWNQAGTYIGVATANQHSVPFDGSTNATATTVGSIRCDTTDASDNSLSGVDTRYAVYGQVSKRVTTGIRATSGIQPDSNYVAGMGMAGLSFSAFNQRSQLFHIGHFVSRASSYLSYIGEPPAIRGVNMAVFQAAEELTIGSDTWVCFPMARKGTTSGQESSGNYGLAYKKVI